MPGRPVNYLLGSMLLRHMPHVAAHGCSCSPWCGRNPTATGCRKVVAMLSWHSLLRGARRGGAPVSDGVHAEQAGVMVVGVERHEAVGQAVLCHALRQQVARVLARAHAAVPHAWQRGEGA